MQKEYTQKDVPAECKMQMKRELITRQRKPKTDSNPQKLEKVKLCPAFWKYSSRWQLDLSL